MLKTRGLDIFTIKKTISIPGNFFDSGRFETHPKDGAVGISDTEDLCMASCIELAQNSLCMGLADQHEKLVSRRNSLRGESVEEIR